MPKQQNKQLTENGFSSDCHSKVMDGLNEIIQSQLSQTVKSAYNAAHAQFLLTGKPIIYQRQLLPLLNHFVHIVLRLCALESLLGLQQTIASQLGEQFSFFITEVTVVSK